MGFKALLIGCAAVYLATPAFAQEAPPPPQSVVGAGDVPTVDALIVTASPIAGDPDRFATTVDRVDHEEILNNGGANLADALRDTPGLAGTGFAAGASRPVIRGMDAQRVKIVENGLSSSDVSDIGPDHGVPIDPLAAQVVEVVRGAATLRYGSQAIGGVVNALNNRIPRARVSDLSGEGSLAYDTVSDGREGALNLDNGKGDFAFHLDAFARQADDYDTPLGIQTNSFLQASGFSAGGSHFFGDSRIGASGTHYQARYGIPAEDTFIDMRQDKGDFGSVLKFEDGALQTVNLSASYADYTHSEIDPAGPEILATFNNREWDGRIETVFGKTGPLSASALGVQLQDRRFNALGEGADYLLPTHTRSVAGFAFVEAPIGPVQFQGAARIENVEINGIPASDAPTELSFTPFSVSGGFSYRIGDDIRIGLTAASAARAPAQTELFARGPHDGPQTFETGDPTLGLERANSLEASLRVKFQAGGKLETSLWGAQFDDYIYGALTGRTCDEAGACAFGGPGDLKELNYAQRDANFWGAEIKGSIPLWDRGGDQLSLTMLGDYVRARFTDGGGDVPRIQPGRIGGGLRWTGDHWDAGFQVLAVSSQTHIGAADTPTDGYNSVDAHVVWRPFGDAKPVEVLLVGHNLANETIRDATALNKAEVVLPGRDVRLVLRTRF